MTITATIIKDSISQQDIRLTSMQLRYPRFIHSEVMTHRVFSRNANSSRAVPVKRLIADIRRDPVMPIYWGKNQPGMHAREELNVSVWVTKLQQALDSSPYDQRGLFKGDVEEFTAIMREDAWLSSMERAIQAAEAFDNAGYHKQIVNRILEPYAHINVLVSATEYSNFYKLRRHADAQPEIKELADRMWEAQEASTPTRLEPGQWHLPYITKEDYDTAHTSPGETLDSDPHGIGLLMQVSVGRCARVSYVTNKNKDSTFKEDIDLADRLLSAKPAHLSPTEHQATPDFDCTPDDYIPAWEYPRQHGNFVGWRQFRHFK